jgi:hypothetical protein
LYSASVHARIALTVVVVHVVSFCIHVAGALAQAAAQLTTVNTCQFVHTAGTHVGTAHQSLINFHVAPSNTAKCPSVLEAGQTTSHTGTVTAHVLPFTDVTQVFCISLLASMFIPVHAQYVVFARGTFTHICPLAFN